MSVILSDMDGVIVDWTGQFNFDLKVWAPELEFGELREFSTPTDLPQAHQDAINFVKNRPGFYADMEPIEGGVDMLNELQYRGHEVWICSSPEVNNPTCESDKKDWLARYMGEFWAKRLILTRDKTLVRGDFLIDDRPTVTGIMEPTWKHLLFHASYNDHVTDRVRINGWSDRATLIAEGVLV